jgi:hypothetical protein
MEEGDKNYKTNIPLDNSKREFKIFASFEEQEAFEYSQMQQLSGKERLMQMRQFINIAYGMHGYDPDNLPTIHTVKILS